MEYYLVIKRNDYQATKICSNLNMNIAEWKMLTEKGYMMYGSIYMTFYKRQNQRCSEQISGSQRCEVCKWERMKSKA